MKLQHFFHVILSVFIPFFMQARSLGPNDPHFNDYQVYVENHTNGSITTSVFSTNGQHNMTTRANDKDWVHAGKSCLQYVTVSNGNGTLRLQPINFNGCMNQLSIKVAQSGNALTVIQATNDLNLRGGSVGLTQTWSGSGAPAQQSNIPAGTPKGVPPPSSTSPQFGDYQVYIENQASTPVTTTLFSSNGQHNMTTKANDKDWVHAGRSCLQYVTISNGAGTLRLDPTFNFNGCSQQLSLRVNPSGAGLQVTAATNDLNFRGSTVGLKQTWTASATPAAAAAAAGPQIKDYQVYVENHSSLPITTTLNTTTGAHDLKTKANDKDWVHAGKSCLQSLSVANSYGTLNLQLPTGFNGCATQLSISVAMDATTGKLSVSQATNDLGLKGSAVTLTQNWTASATAPATPPGVTPEKGPYQVHVKNQAKIDVDVHVYTTKGATICQAVFRQDEDWLHLANDDCIDHIMLRTVLQEGRVDFTPSKLCSFVSLLVDINAQGQPIIVNATNDNNFKGSPVQYKITYSPPLAPS